MKKLLSALALFAFSSAFASESIVNITELNQVLKQQNAGWVARESWVTKMSKTEASTMLGSQDVPEESASFQSMISSGDKFDWRNVSGVNWLGAVMNQGNCGSCVAFATVATAEAQYAISAGAPWMRPTFSTNNLFACGGGSCARGWTPESAARFVTGRGLVDEACSPYLSGATGLDGSCSKDICSNAKDRTIVFKDYSKPSRFMMSSGESVKAALKNGPLVTTMRVYSDFIAYGSGIYKHTTGAFLGGHAISLVGYDDEQRVWIIRNSWGTEWGENGFARISYDDNSGIAGSTWGFITEPEAGYVSVLNPKDSDYVSGNVALLSSVQIKSAQRFKDVPKTSFVITGPNGSTVQGCEKLTSTGCKSQFNTAALPDGRYEIFAETKTEATAPIKSQVRSFYVINSEPHDLSINFTGDGVDLSKPLKERIEFIVNTASYPVNMSAITFVVKDLSGKVVMARRNETVVSKMKLGWRTYAISNGTYDISFKGEIPFNGKLYTVESPIKRVVVKN